MTTHAVLVTGAGGVGKTTLSAAIGVLEARGGKRVLVLTVDPARRLADALGVSELGNEPTVVPHEDGLWAAMLDVTASWEAILHYHAPPDAADRLSSNPFFRAIADRFPAAQSYAAGEQMATFLESGVWDVVVVDTPPSGGGIDFYRAPAQMRDLVGSRVLRIVTGAGLPGRRTLYRLTARPMLRLLDTLLGGALLERIAEFLLDLRTMYDGLSARARVVERLLAEASSVVVTTAEPTPLREARRFFHELPSFVAAPELVVFNRSLPDDWAAAIRQRAPNGLEPDVRAELRDNLKRWAGESQRQGDAMREFAAQHDIRLAHVPWVAEAPTDTDSLHTLVASAGVV